MTRSATVLLLLAAALISNVGKTKPQKLRNIPKDPATRLAWWTERIKQLQISLEHAEAQRELTIQAIIAAKEK